MQCRKEKSRLCGAGWRNDIFDLKNVKETVSTWKSIIGEVSIGCYKDAGNRDLPTLIREANREPRKCFQAAKDREFKYAGL
jgi:hypothetical protein